MPAVSIDQVSSNVGNHRSPSPCTGSVSVHRSGQFQRRQLAGEVGGRRGKFVSIDQVSSNVGNSIESLEGNGVSSVHRSGQFQRRQLIPIPFPPTPHISCPSIRSVPTSATDDSDYLFARDGCPSIRSVPTSATPHRDRRVHTVDVSIDQVSSNVGNLKGALEDVRAGIVSIDQVSSNVGNFAGGGLFRHHLQCPSIRSVPTSATRAA